MKRRTIGIAFVVVGFIGASLGCEKNSVTAGPTTRVFDVSDRSFGKITWPTDAGEIWAIPSPGNVHIIMPAGVELVGRPLLVQFVKYPEFNEIVYTTDGMRFSDAFDRAICYCKCYGIPTVSLEQWKDRGGGNGSGTAGRVSARIGLVEVVIRIASQAPAPKNFAVTLQFDWYRTRELEQKSAADEMPYRGNVGHPSTAPCCDTE